MNGFVNQFLSFDKMIASSIIKIIYFVVLAVLILGGAWRTLAHLFSGEFVQFLLTPIAVVFAILVFRVICELYIVLFQINNSLTEIKNLKVSDVSGDSSQ